MRHGVFRYGKVIVLNGADVKLNIDPFQGALVPFEIQVAFLSCLNRISGYVDVQCQIKGYQENLKMLFDLKTYNDNTGCLPYLENRTFTLEQPTENSLCLRW